MARHRNLADNRISAHAGVRLRMVHRCSRMAGTMGCAWTSSATLTGWRWPGVGRPVPAHTAPGALFGDGDEGIDIVAVVGDQPVPKLGIPAAPVRRHMRRASRPLPTGESLVTPQ